MNYKSIILVLAIPIFFVQCNQEVSSDEDVNVIFKIKFDPDQVRLNNFGQAASIPAGHAAQSPRFNQMGIHYMELSESANILAYDGYTLFNSPTTNEGGNDAIDFDKAMYASDGEVIYTEKLENLRPGNYEYLRMSLSYQNYDIDFSALGLDLEGTIASFIGTNTYIRSFQVKDESISLNENRAQGYWAFETDFPNIPVIEGQAPAGATTVPNPIFELSPIPFGSCLVTGKFETPLNITGNETKDIVVICSVSINDSFEWKDVDGNGNFDPVEGDQVVNMGVRGLIPYIE